MADVILAERHRTYSDFILSKSHSGGDHGFKPISLPPVLFDFQAALDGIRFDMQTDDLFDEEAVA